MGCIYDPKKPTRPAEMMSVERVAIFWVVNASSGEKSCLQFSIPTGSGAGGEGGVSHSLKSACLSRRHRSLSPLGISLNYAAFRFPALVHAEDSRITYRNALQFYRTLFPREIAG